ncbi:MAG: sulfatase-like hydrolase/transferase, partial [Halomonas sp.]|nr:sulfatase-like hydrolase/transferase [Halomonas sp.]
QCQPPEHRPNILLIAVDALRADMLDPRWMPNVSEFADDSQVFANHYSGGNSTKAGGFSLFYGLPSTYWEAFEGTQTPPVWIERLQKLGYQPEILSAATLISPAFDRTVFAGIDDIRLNPPGEEAWQRDRLITDDWLDFTAARSEDAAPFFGFLFYKSVHGYSVPPDFPRIEPYWETVNHLALDEDFDPTPYFNRYKTATRYVDQLIGRVLDDLDKRGLLDDTIVMVTSDHGEEFNDNGENYWGHGSNYSDAQLKVPMVVHWPGKEAGTFTRRTSHADVPATFMKSALGCSATPARSYASGSGLFSSQQREWAIAGSYMNYAIVTGDRLIVTYPTGHYETMTTELEPAPGYDPPAGMLHDVLRELSRFYQ